MKNKTEKARWYKDMNIKRRKLMSLFLAVVMMASMLTGVIPASASGSGWQEDARFSSNENNLPAWDNGSDDLPADSGDGSFVFSEGWDTGGETEFSDSEEQNAESDFLFGEDKQDADAGIFGKAEDDEQAESDVFGFRFRKSDLVTDTASVVVEGSGCYLSMPLGFDVSEEDVLVLSSEYLDSVMKYRWKENGALSAENLLPDTAAAALQLFGTSAYFAPFQITVADGAEVMKSCILFVFRIDGEDVYRYLLTEDNSELEYDDYSMAMNSFLDAASFQDGDLFADSEQQTVLEMLRTNMEVLAYGEAKTEWIREIDFDLADSCEAVQSEHAGSGFVFDEALEGGPEGEPTGDFDIQDPKEGSVFDGQDEITPVVPEDSGDEPDGDADNWEEQEDVDGDEPEQNTNEGIFRNSDEITGLNDSDTNEYAAADDDTDEITDGGLRETDIQTDINTGDNTWPEDDNEINGEFVALMLELRDTDTERYEEVLESLTDEEYARFFELAFVEQQGTGNEQNLPQEEQQDNSTVQEEPENEQESGDDETEPEQQEQDVLPEEVPAESGEQANDILDESADENSLEEVSDESEGGDITDSSDETEENPAEEPSEEVPEEIAEEPSEESVSSGKNDDEEEQAQEGELEESQEQAAEDESEPADEDGADDIDDAEGAGQEQDENENQDEDENEIEIELPDETEADNEVLVEGGEELDEADKKEGVDLFADEELLPETKGLILKGMRAAPMMKGGLLRSSGEKLLSAADIEANTYPNEAAEFERISLDGITLKNLTMRWVSKSTGSEERAGYGTLWLAPDSDIVPNQQWQVNFELEGIGYLDTGAVEITIPAYIWKDRDGNEPGLLTIAVPEEPNTSGTFSWKRVGETVVITNVRPISSGSSYMIQGTFRMTYPDPNADRPFTSTFAHQMVDLDVTAAQNNLYDYTGRNINTGISDDFYCALNVVTPLNNQVISAESNHINAMLTTHVEPDYVVESVVNDAIYTSRPADLPASFAAKLAETASANGMSENQDDYFYVQWYLGGKVRGSQPFDMDTNEMASPTAFKVIGGEEEPAAVRTMLLGLSYTADGDVVNANPLTEMNMTANLYDGYSNKEKAMYAWTAHPKEDFEEGFIYRLKNSHTVTVVGQDDEVLTVSEQASSSVTFRKPITWKINIIWDDNNNAAGRRPTSISSWIDNITQDVRAYTHTMTAADAVPDDPNTWHTEWMDDGSIYDYDGYEYSYAATKYHSTIASGTETTPTQYSDGHSETRQWYYQHVSSNYDEETHTWTFVNKYATKNKVTWYRVMGITKSASGHTDNKVYSTDDKDLQLLRSDRETSDINYNVSTDSFLLENTTREGGSTQNTEDLGQRSIRVELVDYAMYLASRQLGADDFRVTNVSLSNPKFYRWIPDSEGSTGTYQTVAQNGAQAASETYPVYVYGMTGESGAEWVLYGTILNGVLTASNGATANGMNLYFPNGVYVQQVKEQTTTNMARVAFSYLMHTKLMPTEANKAAVESAFALSDYAMLTLQNNAKLYAYGNPGTASEMQLASAVQDTARSYLHGRNYRMAPTLVKETEFVNADTVAGMLQIDNTLTLRQQSNIAFRADFVDAIADNEISASESGTIYDLLPPGMQADISTVEIDYGTVENVNIIENYRNSGRQMLIIDVSLGEHYMFMANNATDKPYPTDGSYPQSGWYRENKVFFTMNYPVAEEAVRGQEYRNNAAYFADEDVFGNLAEWTGEPDNPAAGNHKMSQTSAGILPNDIAMMTDLDTERDTPSVVYAGVSGTITEVDLEALNYLIKKVQVSGANSWSFGYNDEVVVYEGGRYSYQLNETHISGAQAASAAKDIILLDSLENHILVSTDPGYSADGQWAWQGEFQSVDVSSIVDMGCAPVIYYSTVPNLDLVGYWTEGQSTSTVKNKLANASVWTTEAPADLSTVTAVAIDCSKKGDGSDFLLYDQESLIAYIYMKAPLADTGKGFRITPAGARTETVGDIFDPNGEYDEQANNAHAYNRGFVDLTDVQLVENNEPGAVLQHHYIPSGSTRVGIRSFDLEINKRWQDNLDNDGYRPEEVYLYLTIDGTPVNKQAEPAANADDLAYIHLEVNPSRPNADWSGIIEHVRLYDEDNMHISYGLQESSLAPENFWAEWNWTEAEREENTSAEALWTEKYEQDTERTLTSITLVNIHRPDTVTLPVEKEWVSDEPAGWERKIPECVMLKLLADGEDTGKKLIIRPDTNGDWSGTFLDLPAKKNKVDIVYTVEESQVTNFVATQQEEDGIVKLTNRYFPYGDLKVNEQIIEGTATAIENAEFRFTLELTTKVNNETVPVTGKYNYWILNREDNGVYDSESPAGKIGNGDEFVLKDGQSLVVEKIPAATRYEVSQNEMVGFSLVSKTGYSGQIVSGTVAEATFINKYTTTGSLNLKAVKNQVGGTLKRYAFIFSVVDLTEVIGADSADDIEPKEIRRAANANDATAQFGQIRFANADDGVLHVYKIAESRSSIKPGFIYSEEEYFAEVVPTDNGDGTMDVVTHIYRYDSVDSPQTGETYYMKSGYYYAVAPEGTLDNLFTRTEVQLDDVVFTNYYRASGELLLRAWKILKQRELQSDEFSFRFIYAGVKENGSDEFLEDDEMVGGYSVETNSVDGYVASEMTYHEQDIGKVFYYVIEEEKGNDPTVVYDESVYGYRVEVVDNEDGTLSFNQSTFDAEGLLDACPDCDGAGCASCHNNGYVRNTDWEEFSHLMDIEFSLSGVTLGISASGSFDEASEEEAETVKITWAEGVETSVNGDNTTNIVFAADKTFTVGDSIDTDGETDKIFGSEATVEFAGGYKAKITVPTYEELLEDTVAVSVDGEKGELPVFRNELLPGTLQITKDALTNNDEHRDDEFRFRVKLIGEDIKDGDINYALQQAHNESAIIITYETTTIGAFPDGTTERSFSYMWNETSYEQLNDAVLEAPVSQYGFTFNGWTLPDGQPFTFSPDVQQESAVIYADWSKDITITYDANGKSWQDTSDSVVEVNYSWDLYTGSWTRQSGTVPTLPESTEYTDANGFRITETVNGLYNEPEGNTVFEDLRITDMSESSKTAYLSVTVAVVNPDVKYAVSPYAIQSGNDSNGSALGLTFGPAVGGNYFNSFKSHEPDGTTAKGNAHRCVHNDTWEEIVYWNNTDPYVYEQCVTEKCTHTIPLYLDSAIKGSNYSAGYGKITGDGTGAIEPELKGNARVWNGYYNGTDYTTWFNAKGGWAASNIRAVLNGVQPETSNGTDVYDPDNQESGIGTPWAVYAGITEENSLLGSFPEILKENIARKAISSTVFDKLWLLSVAEISASGRFPRFPSGTSSSSTRVAYYASKYNGSTGVITPGAESWCTRSSSSSNYVTFVSTPGFCYGGWKASVSSWGIAPCFALSTEYVP